MSRKKFQSRSSLSVIVAFATWVSVFSFSSPAEAMEVGTKQVSVFHTNDTHGNFLSETAARFKTFIEQEQPTLLLDAGDAFQGVPISNLSEGRDTAKVMNALGYDAMAVGNHEFDFGLDVALSYKDLLDFPILSSNTYKEGELLFDDYELIEKDGVTFAVIGVTTPETKTKTHPSNIEGVTFEEPIPAVQEILYELEGQADSYIVLSHLGQDETTPAEWRGDTLARYLAEDPQLDAYSMLVIDGHSHTAIPAGSEYEDVLLAQTGSSLSNIGIIDYTLGADAATARLVATEEWEALGLDPDAEVSAIVEQANQNFEEATSEVILENNPVMLNGEREYVRTRETNLGNLIGDALTAYGQTGFTNPSDFAMVNGGGIRASISAGEAVTLGDVIAVLPFGNTVTQIEVTGEQIYAMFEHSLRSPTVEGVDENGLPMLGSNGGFLQVSSDVRIYFDSTKEPGQRVLRVDIQDDETGEFEEVNPQATYHMVTNDFLAAGGDGYTMLGGAREEGPSMDVVFAEYLNTVDLSAYTEEFPVSRIIPISQAAFDQMVNPVTEEPVTEEPVTEEPVTEEPITEEPVTEEPVTEEPITEEPVTEEPVTEEPITEEPVTEDPAAEGEKLPQTGAEEAGIAPVAAGLVMVAGGIIGTVAVSRKKRMI